jgi:hypothetical protein
MAVVTEVTLLIKVGRLLVEQGGRLEDVFNSTVL